MFLHSHHRPQRFLNSNMLRERASAASASFLSTAQLFFISSTLLESPRCLRVHVLASAGKLLLPQFIDSSKFSHFVFTLTLHH